MSWILFCSCIARSGHIFATCDSESTSFDSASSKLDKGSGSFTTNYLRVSIKIWVRYDFIIYSITETNASLQLPGDVWSREELRVSCCCCCVDKCMHLVSPRFIIIYFENGVLGICTKWLSKSSSLKCSEHRREFFFYVLLSRSLTIELRRILSFSLGNLYKRMFLSGSG